MPSTASVTDPVEAVVDWELAAVIAEGLGRATLVKVAQRNVDDIQAWCLRMAGTMTGEFNSARLLSYLELAVAVGYRGDETVDHARRDWSELLERAKHLAQETKLLNKAVQLKVDQEVEAAKAVAETEAGLADNTDAVATETDADGSTSPSADEQPDLYEAEKEVPW